MKKNSLPLPCIVAAVILLLLTAGCVKKENSWLPGSTVYDTVPPPGLSATRILGYKVSNITTDSVYGAIDDSAKTITVYLPYYAEIAYIDPVITLPAGSSVVPASGQLVPVFADTTDDKDTTTIYTVTGSDGSASTYKLTIQIQQPAIILNELSTASSIASYNMNTNDLNLKGQNFIPDASVTKTFLINDSTAQKWQLATYPNNSGTSINILYLRPGITYTADPPDTGLYHIRMQAYSLTTTMKYPIRLTR